jgi:hypothetical protein
MLTAELRVILDFIAAIASAIAFANGRNVEPFFVFRPLFTGIPI